MANADTLIKDATTAQQYAGSGSMAMPSYNISDFYSGPMQQTQKYISDPVATALTRTATPAQLSAIQAVPANSYQTPRNTPINRPNEPAGYSYVDTGDNGRATPAMRQLIGLGGAGNGTALPAAGATAPQWGQFEQAYYDAGHKPGTWTAQSRLLAQALMRQMAVRGQARPGVGGVVPTNGLPAPVVRPGGLLPSAPGTFRSSNTGQPVNVGATHVGTDGYTYQAMPNGTFNNLGYSDAVLAQRAAQGQAIGDANRASASPSHDVAGNNNATMSTNHQNSVRWQTGY